MNVTRILPFLTTDDQVIDCGANVLGNVSYCTPRFGYAIEGICTRPQPVPFYLMYCRSYNNLAYLKIAIDWIITHVEHHDNLDVVPIQLYRVGHNFKTDYVSSTINHYSADSTQSLSCSNRVYIVLELHNHNIN